MGRSCYVPGCKTNSQKHKISLFKVPKKSIDTWQEYIPRTDRNLTENDLVCEKHFEELYIIRQITTDVYSYPLKKPRLTDDAIPTIFSNCPQNVTSKPIVKRNTPKIEVNFDNRPEEIQELPYINFVDVKIELPDNIIDNKSLFFQLQQWNFANVSLPSKAWAIQQAAGKLGNFICVSEIVLNDEDDIVLRKKIVLTENNMKVFIFDNLLNHDIILGSSVDISTIFEFENFIRDFNYLRACSGGTPLKKAPNNFVNPLYKKDNIMKVWRHVNCNYLLSETDTQQCQLCEKSRKAIANFKYNQENKLPKKVTLKTSSLKKKVKRLELKNKKLLLELLDLKKRICTKKLNG